MSDLARLADADDALIAADAYAAAEAVLRARIGDGILERATLQASVDAATESVAAKTPLADDAEDQADTGEADLVTAIANQAAATATNVAKQAEYAALLASDPGGTPTQADYLTYQQAVAAIAPPIDLSNAGAEP